jgi:hypothetical protein
VRWAGFGCDTASGWIRQVGTELQDIAGHWGRIAAAMKPGACAVPWGVCPEHGNTLTNTGARPGAASPRAAAQCCTPSPSHPAPPAVRDDRERPVLGGEELGPHRLVQPLHLPVVVGEYGAVSRCRIPLSGRGGRTSPGPARGRTSPGRPCR